MRGVTRGFIVGLALVALAVLGAGAGAEAKTYTIKFATVHTTKIPSGGILPGIEKAVAEKTGGRVVFKPYLGGSLYDDFSAPTQVASGALEMCYGGYNMATISPGWNVLAGLPFLIDSWEHYLRFARTEAFAKMNETLAAKGIMHLAQAGHPGFCDIFNNKHSVEKLEDFKGLKLRIPPIPGLTKMCQVFKAQNVTISPPEVATAMQTKVVDGTFCPIMNLKKYSLVENAPFATRAETTFIPQTIVVNTKFWNGLPPDLQAILKPIFEEFGEKCNQDFRQIEGQLWSIYEKGPGTTVSQLSPEEKTKWQAVVRPIWQEQTAKDPEAKMVLEAVEATRNP